MCQPQWVQRPPALLPGACSNSCLPPGHYDPPLCMTLHCGHMPNSSGTQSLPESLRSLEATMRAAFPMLQTSSWDPNSLEGEISGLIAVWGDGKLLLYTFTRPAGLMPTHMKAWWPICGNAATSGLVSSAT